MRMNQSEEASSTSLLMMSPPVRESSPHFTVGRVWGTWMVHGWLTLLFVPTLVCVSVLIWSGCAVREAIALKDMKIEEISIAA